MARHDYGYDFNFPCGYHPGDADDADQYYFCEETFNNYVEIIESCCFHNKGELAGKPLKLEKWQKDIIAAIFALKRKDNNKRRYSEAMLYVPRKNGKSLFAASIILAYFALDEEKGKQVVSAAGSREQASLIHAPLEFSIKNESSPINSPFNLNPSMKFKCYAAPKKIVSEDTLNEYYPITADAGKQHGLNVSFGITDELHVWSLVSGGRLLEAITTSQGARKEPLLFNITTAANHGDNLCNRKFEYGQKVIDGRIKDSTFLPVLYYLKEDEDWKDPNNWKKVNPNLGVSVNEDFFRKELKKAENDPTYENSFKQYYLNMLTSSEVQFLDFNTWVSLDNVDLEFLKGKECYGGLDLAFKNDLCALVLEFIIDGKYHILTRFWIPEGHKNIEFYREQGWLRGDIVKTTSGNAIDFKQIKQDIVDFTADFDVLEIGYDPKFATELCQSLLDDHDLDMVQVPQTTRYLSEPLKDIQSCILDKKFVHDHNPCADWQIGNATCKTFDDGNIKLIKPQGLDRTLNKVDFVAALSIAHNRVLFNDEYDVNKDLQEHLAAGGSIL